MTNSEARRIGAKSNSISYMRFRNAFQRQWLTEGWPEVPWLCTYKSALRAWPDAPRHSNSVLRYWLGIDIPPDPLMPATVHFATVQLPQRFSSGCLGTRQSSK